MNKNVFYKWFSNLLNILTNIFLVLTLLSCLYVCTYAFSEKIRTYVFIGLAVLTAIVLFIFKNKIKSLVNNALSKINNLDYKKQLLILLVLALLLKVVYTVLFSYDLTNSSDIISRYIKYVNDFVNDGYLTSTIGDAYVALTLHLSLFSFFNIPLHIGMFIVITATILINYSSFKNVIGKDKAFLACLLYLLMPSTTLLSFCPTIEIYIMFYLSLFVFVLYKLLNHNTIINKIIYTLVLIFIVFILRCFGYIGYIAMLVLGLFILLTRVNNQNRYTITIILVISIVVNNTFNSGISYAWRNNEYMCQDIVYGSNYKNKGRFVDDYIKPYVENYLNKNNLKNSHENQQQAYISMYEENCNYLIENPKDLIDLITYKYYVSWGGNHYSIEMLNNEVNISNGLYYFLLGFNEIIYVLVITIGLLANKKDDSISIGTLQLVLVLTSIVLLIRETSNKYALFMTPFIFVICFSKLKE